MCMRVLMDGWSYVARAITLDTTKLSPAANVEIEGTDVAAMTTHAMFDLDCELKTKLDFAKTGRPKAQALMALEVLFVDEVSMIDTAMWATLSRSHRTA